MDGKKKELDTNFKVRVFNHDSLLCEVQAHSMLVEMDDQKKQLQRFTSLVQLPVIKLGPSPDLRAEIIMEKETIKWDANLLVYHDSLKFCDSFGLYIYKFVKPRKFSKASKDCPTNPRLFEKKYPGKDAFPFILMGWLLEEVEIEIKQIK